MCNVCCKEFRGWCTAFTRTERLLTILELILILVFIAFLTFLILHLIVCSKQGLIHEHEVTTSSHKEKHTTTQDITATSESTILFGGEDEDGKRVTDDASVLFTEAVVSTTRQTLAPDVQCTWKPSQKTKATTHYYDPGVPSAYVSAMMEKLKSTTKTVPNNINVNTLEDSEVFPGVEESDGEEPDIGVDRFVIALVKINPMRDTTFGCILTIISEYWTLTAASCIESIEEVDSLDSFVMLEGYGRGAGAAHAVGDVLVHPLYGGANVSYDLAALKSEDALTPGAQGFVELPTMLDYLLLTVGERLMILGYGKFRSISKSVKDRSVHEMFVYSLPMRACAGEDSSWSLRHLSRPEPLPQGACVVSGVCAGSLHARGVPCNYCAGTPLLRARRLLGVMASSTQCGVACEPATYVNVANVRDWIDALVDSD